MFDYNIAEKYWINEPKKYEISTDKIIITTEPNTDFWQRTYYGFQNDNGPALLCKTEEKYFSFTVKTEFDSSTLFDQCGVIIYQNSDNWFKSAIEYHNNNSGWLGSVVTNHGYSDWATTDIDSETKAMWYRLSRRESDYCIEVSKDGINFEQMRIFHLFEGGNDISFGVFACSPVNGTFHAKFTYMQVTECMWKAH